MKIENIHALLPIVGTRVFACGKVHDYGTPAVPHADTLLGFRQMMKLKTLAGSLCRNCVKAVLDGDPS